MGWGILDAGCAGAFGLTVQAQLNLKTAVERYYDRLILEFKGIFAEICLTVGWLLLSPNFGKNPFKFGVLAALATSSTVVFRLKRFLMLEKLREYLRQSLNKFVALLQPINYSQRAI